MFNLERLQFVFKHDESNDAPAVTEIVETLDEIQNIFGPIAYYKAGSVLRMFENAIGTETFRDVLRSYVKLNHHKVVSPGDLYLEFENILMARNFVQFDFTESFQSWELQKGYPVIHVTFDRDQNQFHITQTRFFVNQDIANDADSTWFIPLNFATSREFNFDDTAFTHFFEIGSSEKVIEIEDEIDWFLFNKQQLGYYRVNYEIENWKNLIDILNSKSSEQIHVLNRAQLIDDAMSFAEAGMIDYEIATGILMYLREEVDYVPWAAASIYFDKLYDLFGRTNYNLNVSLSGLSL